MVGSQVVEEVAKQLSLAVARIRRGEGGGFLELQRQLSAQGL